MALTLDKAALAASIEERAATMLVTVRLPADASLRGLAFDSYGTRGVELPRALHDLRNVWSAQSGGAGEFKTHVELRDDQVTISGSGTRVAAIIRSASIATEVPATKHVRLSRNTFSEVSVGNTLAEPTIPELLAGNVEWKTALHQRL